MTSHAKLAAFAAAIAFAAVNSASAQVLYYDHHSTAFGDWQGGYAEVLHGQAAYVKAEAEAAKTWVEARSAYDDLDYQHTEHLFQKKELKRQYQNQLREDKLARQAVALAANENAAIRLHKTAQMGIVAWPAAMQRPEYSASVSLIESILRNWSPNDDNGEAYRRALATETGVLRSKITNSKNIPHNSKLEAVRTIKKLQMLAGVTNGSAGGAQLAMY